MKCIGTILIRLCKTFNDDKTQIENKNIKKDSKMH